MSGISCFFSMRTTPMPSSSGICRSSSARSGRSRSIAATASLPDAASRHDRRRRRTSAAAPTRNDRAGRSSSAMTTRRRAFTTRSASARARRGGSVLGRQADLDGRAGARRALDRQRGRGAVLAGEPALDVAQADAARAAARCSVRAADAGAGVVDDERRARASSPASSSRAVTVTSPPRRCGAMPCLTAFSTSGCSRSGGTRRLRSAAGTSMRTRRRCSNRARSMSRYDSISSSSRPSVVNSPSERSTLRSSAVSRISVVERAGRRGLNQVADRRQRVEQEMRIDLRAQRPQLGLGGQLADLLLAQLARVALVREADRVDAAADERRRSPRARRGRPRAAAGRRSARRPRAR